MKNGEVVQIGIIPIRSIWERANPWFDLVRLRNINEDWTHSNYPQVDWR